MCSEAGTSLQHRPELEKVVWSFITVRQTVIGCRMLLRKKTWIGAWYGANTEIQGIVPAALQGGFGCCNTAQVRD